MSFRRARSSDCPELCALHSAAIRQLCVTHYPASIISRWIAHNTVSRYLALVEDAQQEVVVATDSWAIVGFGVLSKDGSAIEEVCVEPLCVGRGVGRTLVGHLEWLARARGVEALSVSATMNAAPFFSKLGYLLLRTERRRHSSGVTLLRAEMQKLLPRKANRA